MEFRQDGDNMGSGGGNSALMGLLAGSALNKDRDRDGDDGKTVLLASVVFVIVFIIAIIAFAMMFRDGRNDRRDIGGGTDYAALLTPLIAAKSMESNGSNSNFDMLEIKQKLEHNEDRAVARETQQQINQQGKSFMELGFGLSGQIRDTEKTTLEKFATVENQLGQIGMGVTTLLQERNNEAIINGLFNKLCVAGR